MRRTPLRRTQPLLPRTSLPRSRTPLPQQSTRRRLQATARRRLVVRMLEEFPVCFACQAARAVDLHELRNRSQGGDFLDPDGIVTLCRACHDRVTREPAWAVANGLTIQRKAS